MNLQSERLDLIPMTAQDLDEFHKTNTNPFVRKFLWDDEEIPESISADILNEIEAKFKNENWGLWKIIRLDTKEYLGYIGFWFFFEEKLPQLLYALLPEFTGKGYATEASTEIINYAFEKLNFEHLIASMDKPNQDSIRVCERLNMKLMEVKEIEGNPTLFYKLENNDSLEALATSNFNTNH